MNNHPTMTHPTRYNATYRLIGDLPTRWWLHETLTLALELTNTGHIAWESTEPSPVRLSYHWQDSEGHMIIYDGERSSFPTTPPGSSVNVELKVVPPYNPGAYELMVDLVHEEVTWFSEQGVAPLILPITYLHGALPRVTIISAWYRPGDLLSSYITAQIRALRAASYDVLLLVEQLAPGAPPQPDSIHDAAIALTCADIEYPRTRRSQHARNHLFISDIIILNYATAYPLTEVITLVSRPVIIFDYHTLLMPEHQHQALPTPPPHLLRHADYAIAHSACDNALLCQCGLLPPGRIFTIPYSIGTLPHLRARELPDTCTQSVPPAHHCLLAAGPITPQQHTLDLIAALAQVQQHHPATILVLFNEQPVPDDADYLAQVQERIAALGCQQHVIMAGAQPAPAPFYQRGDLFLLAGAEADFRLPALKAMAHGIPVVAADVPALRDIVAGGGVSFAPGHPADLAAQVVALLNDRQTRPSHSAPPDSAELACLQQGTIAFVAPRYGVEILGGAERHIRAWAEQLAARGYHVEVMTTCTREMSAWSNDFAPGVEHLNGVVVRRFPTDQVAREVFHTMHARAIRGVRLSYNEELALVYHNFQSSDLTRYLREHADAFAGVIFAPYLFGTTYWGMQAVPGKALILPCLHDEPAAQLSVFRDMLEHMDGILFNTATESAFASRVVGVTNPFRTTVGYGFEPNPPAGDGATFCQRYHLPEQIVLYSGRLVANKNVPLLLEYFMRYKEEYPGPLTLVLTGSGDVPVPRRADIVATGILPEEELSDAYAAALVLCQPSLQESFSIVIMEAWMQRKPVLVHADCAVTTTHVEQSGGGATFHDYASFRDALHHLHHDTAAATAAGARGYHYVQQHYTWPMVIERLLHGIIGFTRPRSPYQHLAQRARQWTLAATQARFEHALSNIAEEARLAAARSNIPLPHQHHLFTIAHVGAADYQVRSALPLFGSLLARLRQRMTMHLKEAYFDPLIDQQTAFNHDFVRIAAHMLERSRYEQRQLTRELELLRDGIIPSSDKG